MAGWLGASVHRKGGEGWRHEEAAGAEERVVAGDVSVKVDDDSQCEGKQSIIRAMPNTACAFRKGVTALYALDQNSEAFIKANSLFKKIGHVLTLQNEDEMHRFTSIIGSGQAFLFQVLNTYLEELKKISSADHVATKLMFQDFISSLSDSFSQDSNFESLINKIKSPGGTTQAGLESLQDNNLDKILQDAFQAAEDRSIEISNEQ